MLKEKYGRPFVHISQPDWFSEDTMIRDTFADTRFTQHWFSEYNPASSDKHPHAPQR